MENMAWKGSYMYCFLCNIITHLCPKFNDGWVEPLRLGQGWVITSRLSMSIGLLIDDLFPLMSSWSFLVIEALGERRTHGWCALGHDVLLFMHYGAVCHLVINPTHVMLIVHIMSTDTSWLLIEIIWYHSEIFISLRCFGQKYHLVVNVVHAKIRHTLWCFSVVGYRTIQFFTIEHNCLMPGRQTW